MSRGVNDSITCVGVGADTLYSKKLDERSALIIYPAADTLYSKKLDERSALIIYSVTR